MIALMMLALGCSDPELDPFKDALGDYDRGQEAVSREDWPAAIGAFQDALDDHPGSPSLHLWLAHAQASGGDLDAARATLDQGVARNKSHVELRYNRAAYAARGQDLEAAAKDLRYLYARQLLDPYVAGEDDDFRTLGVIPRFAELAPVPRVEVAVSAALGEVLRGEELSVELTVRARSAAPLSVSAPPLDGRLVQRAIIEDTIGEGEGWTLRSLSAVFEAASEGPAQLGPVQFQTPRSEAQTGPLPVSVITLPGQKAREAAGEGPAPVWLPSALLGDKEAPWAGRLDDGRVAVLMLPGMEGRIAGAEDVVRLERREKGQTVWRALVGVAGPDAEVTLRRGAREVMQKRVP